MAVFDDFQQISPLGIVQGSQAEIIDVAGDVLGRRVPCLYGGSVNPGNCEELIGCPSIDGRGLVMDAAVERQPNCSG